jgi:hypothetical protein
LTRPGLASKIWGTLQFSNSLTQRFSLLNWATRPAPIGKTCMCMTIVETSVEQHGIYSVAKKQKARARDGNTHFVSFGTNERT